MSLQQNVACGQRVRDSELVTTAASLAFDKFNDLCRFEASTREGHAPSLNWKTAMLDLLGYAHSARHDCKEAPTTHTLQSTSTLQCAGRDLYVLGWT